MNTSSERKLETNEERTVLAARFLLFNNYIYYMDGLIEKVVITNWVVFAVWVSMTEKMIFERIGDWFDFHLLNDKLKFWIFECPICMQSLYGSIFYWLWYGNNWKEWLVVVIASVGLAAIIVKFLKATID